MVFIYSGFQQDHMQYHIVIKYDHKLCGGEKKWYILRLTVHALFVSSRTSVYMSED